MEMYRRITPPTDSTHLHKSPRDGDVVDPGGVTVHWMRVGGRLRWQKLAGGF